MSEWRRGLHKAMSLVMQRQDGFKLPNVLNGDAG